MYEGRGVADAAQLRADLLLVVQKMLIRQQLLGVLGQVGVACAEDAFAAEAIADERLA
jgi:hypothetical protein